jgi:hypothetical protein
MPLTPLLSVASSDFIKNFPLNHGVNMDRIDDWAGPSSVQSYTPELTASVTNPTLGTGGSISGRYIEIFDFIFTWGEFRFGTSGHNQGSGTFEITLPFPAASVASPSQASGAGPQLGTSRLWDNSSGSTRTSHSVQLRSSTKIMFSVKYDSGAGGRALGSGIPFAWDVSDGMNWCAKYKRLDS